MDAKRRSGAIRAHRGGHGVASHRGVGVTDAGLDYAHKVFLVVGRHFGEVIKVKVLGSAVLRVELLDRQDALDLLLPLVLVVGRKGEASLRPGSLVRHSSGDTDGQGADGAGTSSDERLCLGRAGREGGEPRHDDRMTVNSQTAISGDLVGWLACRPHRPFNIQ